MVVVSPAPAALSPRDLSVFYTTDDLLAGSPVLVLYGSSSNSSRMQVHVYTPAGFASFVRLIVSPATGFYKAVECLTREEQGDEIARGLAFSLYKYFTELPAHVRNAWEKRHNAAEARLPAAPKLFSDAHAAMLAGRMDRVHNVAQVVGDVRQALGELSLSWLDLDVVLPAGAIQKPAEASRDSAPFDEPENRLLEQRYGGYASVVRLFGEKAFLPTSRLKRAPSRPTPLNRSQSFSRSQKESLRREMCELLDTEESYVGKVHDLTHSVAANFRQKAKHCSTSSASPSEQALQGLFPPSLDKILEVNSGFMDAIRRILEETENDAINDIENGPDDFASPPRGQSETCDVTGALALARALVEWFPKFADCYANYMQAHSEFSQLLKMFTKDAGSSFSKRVQETGEQRLMSMLIEPVQRLPRYNLYIDNIVKQLPLRHPAVKLLLRARDIISDICSRDVPSAQNIKVFDRLRKAVFSWPPSLTPAGRLTAAIDFVELSPPYHGNLHGAASNAGIFLLFVDCLVVLHKPAGSSVSARSLMSDLDNPKCSESSASTELIFHQQLKLSDIMLLEHTDGKILQMISPKPASTQPSRPRSRDATPIGIRMFLLAGAHEGKAQRCMEDIVKARVEGRFAEKERESCKWEVRSVTGELSLLSAVFEDDMGAGVKGRREPARVQVTIDPANTARQVTISEGGVELSVSVSLLRDDLFLLEMLGLDGYSARNELTTAEFLPVLTKRRKYRTLASLPSYVDRLSGQLLPNAPPHQELDVDGRLLVSKSPGVEGAQGSGTARGR